MSIETFQEREIRALLSKQDHDKYLVRSLKKAQMTGGSKMFNCKTLNCVGFAEIGGNVQWFKCYICRATNCIHCQVSGFYVKSRIKSRKFYSN